MTTRDHDELDSQGRYRDVPSEPTSRAGSPLHGALDIDPEDNADPLSQRSKKFWTRASQALTNGIPEPVRRAGTATIQWTKGPDPPRQWHISPLFPHLQTAPTRLLDHSFPKPKHKACLLVGFYFLWLLIFTLVLNRSAFSSEVAGYGAPIRLSCSSRYW